MKDIPGAEIRIAPNETLYIINLDSDKAEQVIAATEDSASTEFEHSVACIGATTCQQGVRDSSTSRAGRSFSRTAPTSWPKRAAPNWSVPLRSILKAGSGFLSTSFT